MSAALQCVCTQTGALCPQEGKRKGILENKHRRSWQSKHLPKMNWREIQCVLWFGSWFGNGQISFQRQRLSDWLPPGVRCRNWCDYVHLNFLLFQVHPKITRERHSDLYSLFLWSFAVLHMQRSICLLFSGVFSTDSRISLLTRLSMQSQITESIFTDCKWTVVFGTSDSECSLAKWRTFVYQAHIPAWFYTRALIAVWVPVATRHKMGANSHLPGESLSNLPCWKSSMC